MAYTRVMATLRCGQLGNGDWIPAAYALETNDGRSIVFQNGYEYRALAYHLGAPVDPDVSEYDEMMKEHDKAVRWLDKRVGKRFNIAGTYDEMLE
jgi:hypothetical protein